MRVMLGDQSPLNGGVLRAQLLAKLLPDAEVTYCFHDTDAPWIQTLKEGDAPKVSFGKWPSYWALAARMPFTLDAPELGAPDIWTGARQSLGAGPGLTYLLGPKTCETIASRMSSPHVGSLVRQMHEGELKWARQLAGLLGVEPGGVSQIPTSLCEVVPAITERLVGTTVSVTRTTEYWKAHGVQFHTVVPPSEYWRIDEEGCRFAWQGGPLSQGHFLVPRAHVRSLEEAALGVTDCFTTLPYLGEVAKLRDRYVPGLKIPYIRMTLDWVLPEDPVLVLTEAFVKKKTERARAKQLSPVRPELPEDDASHIRSYWKGRPTTIAYEVLGGKLTAQMHFDSL